jgi:hypothetical protein
VTKTSVASLPVRRSLQAVVPMSQAQAAMPAVRPMVAAVRSPSLAAVRFACTPPQEQQRE